MISTKTVGVFLAALCVLFTIYILGLAAVDAWAESKKEARSKPGTIELKGFRPDGYAAREMWYFVVVHADNTWTTYRTSPHSWKSINIGDPYPLTEK